jgi:hypothetical protein
MEPIRPLKKSCTLPVLQAVSGLSLTKSADEHLLNHAKFMSEGAVETGETGGSTYYGSTFVTIDLRRADIDLREEEDMPGAFVKAVEHSVFFRLRMMRFARVEAERRCLPYLISEMFVQTEFRIDDMRLFIDINVECPLAMPQSKVYSREEGSG